MGKTEVTLFERYIGDGKTVCLSFHPSLGPAITVGSMFHHDKNATTWLLIRDIPIDVERLDEFTQNQILLTSKHNQDQKEFHDNEMITCWRCNENKIKRLRFHKQDGCCDYCWQQGWRSRWDDDMDGAEYYNENTGKTGAKR